MTYADILMFMEKLKQLINCNDNPLFNNQEIIGERPQFQLLYQDLGSTIQTLFIDEHQDVHDVEKVNDLKERCIYAAEEAQYMVDLFLSGVHLRNNGIFPTSDDFNPSINLDDVRKSLESVKVEFISMIMDKMKLDASRRPERTFNQLSLRSKKVLDEIVVGIDRDVELIRDKLVEDQKKLDVVSIVGMGGIGKTTLAIKIFNDRFVVHHFYVRAWVTVSQTYDKGDVLIQILASMGVKLNLEKANDFRLRELVHKHLMGKRYLIVIDDIWNTETWDNLKLFFPHDNTGSRILLTSRLTEIAKHANSDGLIHHLGYLNKDKSWELLCQKVFNGNDFPDWSIKPGMQIVESCQGLPLALVVIAGILAKEAWSEKLWVEIADKTGSYIVGDQNGTILETLGLSYNHLPLHLRECFLYLGGFPEDHKFQVQRLIWLWTAEGFIQRAGNQSLEDTAEGYLMDLIDRNLVTVAGRRKSNGAVKACKVHDLVRELCLKKAKEELFVLKTERQIFSSQSSSVIAPPYKPVRMFINKDINILGFPSQSAQNLRSILFFSSLDFLSEDIAKYFISFLLLRVLDLEKCSLSDFPKGMELLVHLRYLVISDPSTDFPSSICSLWSLQTLIYTTRYGSKVNLPASISDLVNLRHLRIYMPFFLPSIEKPMNLQTISDVELGHGVENFNKCFPYIKELRCTTFLDEENDFKSLAYLENLNLTVRRRTKSSVHESPKGEPSYGKKHIILPASWKTLALLEPACGKNHITFPETLKTLTLAECCLPWSNMCLIQSLPNLQVLKLRYRAFAGCCWNTYEQEFQQLKFLRLEVLDIKLWEAYSTSFPCLKQLEIFSCKDLEEIPLEIGDIPTLELIKIKNCRHSVGESVRRIQEEQHDFGNYDLKIDIFEDTSSSQFWEW